MSSRMMLLASAARTTTVSTDARPAGGHRGIHIIIKSTAHASTPSVVPTIEGKDPASGDWYALLTGAAITGEGTVVLRLYPGIAAVANVAVSGALPSPWRLTMTAADADSLTYSVGAELMP